MPARKLLLNGSEHPGVLRRSQVDSWRCRVTTAGEYVFRSRSLSVLVLEVCDRYGNVLASDRGRYRLGVCIELAVGTYYVVVSGNTSRTYGRYTLTGQRNEE